jgi:UDP-glucuronate 4-epimerase
MRGLRFFTVYGPWGRPDMAYFKLIESALNGSKFPQFGDGSVKRDFTFVDDTVKSIYLLAEEMCSRNHGYFDIVNVGGGKPYSLKDLISEIENQTGVKIAKDNLEPIAGDVKLTIADSSLLHLLTGQVPETTLQQGVEITLRWASQAGIRDQLSKWIL